MRIVEKETHGNNLVQAEDTNANEMVFNIYLMLTQARCVLMA